MGLLAVIAATVAAFAFGAVWYGLLAGPWKEASGVALGEDGEPLNAKSPVPYVTSFVCILLVTGMMRHSFATADIETFSKGILSGGGIGSSAELSGAPSRPARPAEADDSDDDDNDDDFGLAKLPSDSTKRPATSKAGSKAKVRRHCRHVGCKCCTVCMHSVAIFAVLVTIVSVALGPLQLAMPFITDVPMR